MQVLTTHKRAPVRPWPGQVGSAQRIATMQMKEADSGRKGKKRGGGGGGDEDEGARGFMAGGGGKKGRR